MSHTFEVVDSTLLVDAPVIALRRDEVVMPGGRVASREVVENLGAVAVVAVDENERVAMVYQYRRPLGTRLWELPAGLLDIKGEDELTGAKRELQEEAGLQAKRWEVLSDIATSPGFSEEAVRIFLARDLSMVDKLHDTGDEEQDMTFAWVDLDEAVNRVLAGEIVNSIACVGILATHAVLRGGRATRSTDVPFPLRPTSMAKRRPGPDLKKK